MSPVSHDLKLIQRFPRMGDMHRESGSYILVISLVRDASITVGKLGRFSFPLGYYLYTGSALGGLSRRLHRHLKNEKKLYWHIDYLLEHSEIMEVWYISSTSRLECLLARATRNLRGAIMPARGFGASDCRCPSHLVYFPARPRLADFVAELHQLSDNWIFPVQHTELDAR